jgi:glutamate racemase
VINYHKLGSETCKAAALNSRFPPSFVIQVALVQQSQQQQLRASTEGSFRSGRDTDRSSSPPPKGSPRVGQQTVVHVQCAHFEFTLRQIQQDKKKTDTTTSSSRAAAAAYRTELSTLQNVKKTQSRRESFDSADSSRKRSRVELISGFHRLKQLFHSKSRQH